jgi:hypothetical protein
VAREGAPDCGIARSDRARLAADDSLESQLARMQLLDAQGIAPSEPLYARKADQSSLPEDWDGWIDRQAAYRAWLRGLGGGRTLEVLASRHAITVRWRGEAALRRAVEQERKAMTREFAAMVQELLRKRVLTGDEARDARADVHVGICDQRGDTREKLPDLSHPAGRMPIRM